MGYTDKELRDATQIAYLDLKEGYDNLDFYGIKPPYTIKQIINATKNLNKRADLVNKIKEGDISIDIDSWKITQIHDKNINNGFYGCIIETSDKEAIVAFRGSESTTDDQFKYDWVDADIGLLNEQQTKQQREVEEFLDDIQTMGYLDKYTSVASTGHSLGGNLSDYFTIRSVAFGLSDKIKQSYNFDGPGFSNEFLEHEKENIDSISKVMKHYQWSAVGNLLFPVPGVEFVTSDIKDYRDTSTYLQNAYTSELAYDLICRHDTRSLVYDEQGNILKGKMDGLAWFMGKLSKGIDRLPSVIGNTLKNTLSYFLLHGDEIKGLFINNKGLTLLSIGLAVGAAIAVLTNPLGTLIIAAKVITGIVAIIAGAVGMECLIELFESVVDKIGDLVSDAKKMVKKKVDEFKALLKNEAGKIINLAKYAMSLLTNKKVAHNLQHEVTSKIRDYSSVMLEDLKDAYSRITLIEFFDMDIWNKKYAYEKWYIRLLMYPIQHAAYKLIDSVQEDETSLLKKVTKVFEEVEELDDNFAKYLNTKSDELNTIAGILV